MPPPGSKSLPTYNYTYVIDPKKKEKEEK